MSASVPDVIVVGAGPCGSTAAYEIAKAGYEVLLLERDEYPGQYNSCGGGLGNFLVKKFDLPEKILHKKIRTVQLHLGEEIKTYRAEQPIYVSIKRTEFDRFLAGRATQAGAQLRCLQKVIDYDPYHRRLKILDRPSGALWDIQGKLVIFADGATTQAWTSCRVGVDPAQAPIIGIAYELGYPDNPHEAFEFFFDEQKLAYGYYWIFPTKDTLNVGMGGPRDKLGGQAGRMLAEFIAARTDLAQLKPVRKSSGIIPGRLASQFHGEGIMVVGDAGGFVNPLTGGGIYLGMVSAQMAAREACEAFSCGRFDSPFFSRYTRRIKTSPYYAGLKVFHAMVNYSQRHLKRTGRPILGKIFKLYSDIGDIALRKL